MPTCVARVILVQSSWTLHRCYVQKFTLMLCLTTVVVMKADEQPGTWADDSAVCDQHAEALKQALHLGSGSPSQIGDSHPDINTVGHQLGFVVERAQAD